MNRGEIFLSDSRKTEELGYLIGECLKVGNTILLQGDLGVGKTTLVQGIGRSLNIEEPISSPTFTLVNEYMESRIPLYHIDLYRLTKKQVMDFYPEIYWEGMEKELGVTVIEWSERLSYKPRSFIEVNLSYFGEDGRKAILSSIGNPDFNLEKIIN